MKYSKLKIILSLLVAFGIGSSSSCRRDEREPEPTPTEKNLNLIFYPKYKNNVWIANKVYALNDTARVRFTKFSFFITDVR